MVMYKRKLDIMVESNEKKNIEIRVCNGSKCKGKEVPLNQNNFFIVNGNYEDNCSRCSEYRRCGLCMEVKDISGFHKRQPICKPCDNLERHERYNGFFPSSRNHCPDCGTDKLKSQFLFINGVQEEVCYLCSDYKRCSCCRYIKPRSEFHKNKSNTDGYSKKCKCCKNKESVDHCNRSHMTCSDCGITKPKNEMNSKHYRNCNLCYKTKISVPRMTWCCNEIKQPEEFRSGSLTECKPCFNIKNNIYMNERYRTDPIFRTRCIVRSVTSRIGIFKGSKKTIELLGAPIEFVLDWLRYTSGYTLDIMNDDVHIDHVTPISSFNFNNEEEQYKCCNWKNLRLCPGKENLEKSDKIDIELIEHQRKMVEDYICK